MKWRARNFHRAIFLSLICQKKLRHNAYNNGRGGQQFWDWWHFDSRLWLFNMKYVHWTSYFLQNNFISYLNKRRNKKKSYSHSSYLQICPCFIYVMCSSWNFLTTPPHHHSSQSGHKMFSFTVCKMKLKALILGVRFVG